jgi:hypothetical protein
MMDVRALPVATRRSLRLAVELVMLLVLPVLLESASLISSWRGGNLGIDMEQGLLPPAELVRHGVSPFVTQHYPPLVPVLLVPFTFLPSPAVVLAMLAAACVPATLWAFDVRDWRCYGAAFLWPPVYSGIQTANVTLFLVLASALAWRFRDRAARCATASGLAIGAKLISLPLIAWLWATGRACAAAVAIAIAAGSTVVLGIALEISLHNDAAGTVGRFEGVITDVTMTPSYSVIDVSRSLGASTWAALGVLSALVLALAVACVRRGRRGDDSASFSIACLASLVAAPNVWLHSFAFLLPVVALARPRFSVMWLVPVLFVTVPVREPSPLEILTAWAVTGAVALFALHERTDRHLRLAGLFPLDAGTRRRRPSRGS